LGEEVLGADLFAEIVEGDAGTIRTPRQRQEAARGWWAFSYVRGTPLELARGTRNPQS